MQGFLDALVSWVTGLLELVWKWVNYTMVQIIDGALFLWPATPTALKLSTHFGALQASMPGAPWWVVGDLVRSAVAILGISLTWKVLKMVRG